MFKRLSVSAAVMLAAVAGHLITPAQAGTVTVYDASAPTCREFTSTITVGNTRQEGVGTACLQGDGSWQIVAGPGTGTSFFDNGIPTAYPASSYVASNSGYYNDVYYGRPVYYQEPVRVRYIVNGRRYGYRPAPVVVTRIDDGWDGPGFGITRRGRPDWPHPYGRGRPYHGWDDDRRRGDGHNDR